MADCDASITDSMRLLESHYAMTEAQKYKLHLMRRALGGLASLTAPDELEFCQQEANPAREDLAAIFELLGSQLEEIMSAMAWMPAAAIRSAENIAIFATKKGSH